MNKARLKTLAAVVLSLSVAVPAQAKREFEDGDAGRAGGRMTPERAAARERLPAAEGGDGPAAGAPGPTTITGRDQIKNLPVTERAAATAIMGVADRGAASLGLKRGDYSISYNTATKEARVILNDGAAARVGVRMTAVDGAGRTQFYETGRNNADKLQNLSSKGAGGVSFVYNEASAASGAVTYGLAQKIEMNADSFNDTGNQAALDGLSVGGNERPAAASGDLVVIGAAPAIERNPDFAAANPTNIAAPVLTYNGGAAALTALGGMRGDGAPATPAATRGTVRFQTPGEASRGTVRFQTPDEASRGTVRFQTPAEAARGTVRFQTPDEASRGTVRFQTPAEAARGTVRFQTPDEASRGTVRFQTPEEAAAMPGTGGASNAVPKQVADFVARPGAAVQVFQRQPGNANRFEVRATPAQMSQTFKDQALGLAQRNPDPRVAAAVGGLLNGPGLRNVQVRIQVERVGGQPQIRGLDVAARGTLPAMRLVVNRDGVMGLAQGGPRVAPPAPQPAAPAGVLRLGQAATPSGGLNVVLNNLAPTMNAFRGQPTPRTLNVATIGAKFDNALRAYASEFPRSLNNPQSNYNKAVDGLRRAGYDPATNLFSRPPQGNTDVRRTLIEAWQLLANQR